jgi:hypothetical protein
MRYHNRDFALCGIAQNQKYELCGITHNRDSALCNMAHNHVLCGIAQHQTGIALKNVILNLWLKETI